MKDVDGEKAAGRGRDGGSREGGDTSQAQYGVHSSSSSSTSFSKSISSNSLGISSSSEASTGTHVIMKWVLRFVLLGEEVGEGKTGRGEVVKGILARGTGTW